jgi:hypothetical protein
MVVQGRRGVLGVGAVAGDEVGGGHGDVAAVHSPEDFVVGSQCRTIVTRGAEVQRRVGHAADRSLL